MARLGIFWRLAARNRSANRGFIAFTPWSSFAHRPLVAVEALGDGGERLRGAVPSV